MKWESIINGVTEKKQLTAELLTLPLRHPGNIARGTY